MQSATCLQQKLSEKLGASASQVKSCEPALFCPFLVTALPRALPNLTAQQKYSLSFISLGGLLENCSKQKQGLNIKSQSQSPQGLLSQWLLLLLCFRTSLLVFLKPSRLNQSAALSQGKAQLFQHHYKKTLCSVILLLDGWEKLKLQSFLLALVSGLAHRDTLQQKKEERTPVASINQE